MSKKFFLFLILSLLLLLSFCFAFMFGGSSLCLKDIFSALLHPWIKGVAQTIIWQIRFPRIILALFVGAALASCGATLQGILRNPLAEPYTLGVSGGAALGATLGIILGAGGVYLPLFAFVGSSLSIFLVYTIAARKHFSNPTLILGGVILSFLFSSCVLLILAVSRAEKVHSTILWLMGDLSSAGNVLIKTIPFFILPGIVILMVFGRDLNILTLGEEKATHLGIEVESIKRILFIITSLLTAVCVAASGIIGFVGLIVPHFMRYISGPDHRTLLPAAALGGAIFLILCDTLARTLIRPVELPVGVITGILGGLFFLNFLIRARRWEIF